MSTCTKWVDQGVFACKNWSDKLDYECTTWADEGSNQCSNWADEGSNQCSTWADEGSNECSAWAEQNCHWYSPWNCIAGWFCQAYYWVAKWVCKAYYWVAKWVCKAYYWVAKWVCKAFAWIVKAICTVWSWVAKLVCVAWDTLRCAISSIVNAIGNLFSGKRKPSHKIEHVFVLMLENRSFDHMLGFSGITGTDISGAAATIEGINPSIHNNVNPANGSVVAANCPADFLLKDVDKDPGHEFKNALTQLCGKSAVYSPAPGGYPPINNSGFIQNYADDGSPTPERIMKCFCPEQLPVMNALAKEFAVCDNWFSSLPGPTWPNRFFALAATSAGLDDSPSTGDVIAATTLEGYRFENGNIFDLLDDHCLNWRIFEGDEFPVSFALNGMNLNALQGRFSDFSEFEDEINKSSLSEKFIFIEPKYGEDEFDLTGPGDYVCGNSMHPLNDVTRGEKLIKKVYEVIRNSPHWEKSVLVITFDEHGGFYDHVAPPAAVPPGDLVNPPNVKNNFKFDQLGVRIPTIIVSPLIRKNTIDKTVYDHTSSLASIEKLFGLPNLTNRDKAANDFLHLFSLDTPRTDTPTTLPNAANSGFTCEDDAESAEDLIQKRSEFLSGKKRGNERYNRLVESAITPMQTGFAHVALLKLLQASEYPEREAWKEEFKNLKSELDVAVFLTEAKLKIRHNIDIKKMLREAQNETLRNASGRKTNQ